MQRIIRAACGLLIVLAAIDGAMAQPQPEPQPTIKLRGYLRVVADPQSGLEHFAAELLKSSSATELIGEAAPEVARQGGVWIFIDDSAVSSEAPGIMTSAVSIGTLGKSPPPAKILHTVAQGVEKILQRVDTQQLGLDDENLKRCETAVMVEEVEMQRRKGVLDQLAASTGLPADPQLAGEALERHRRQVSELAYEAAGLAVRQKALEKQIALLANATANDSPDAVEKELMLARKLRERTVQAARAFRESKDLAAEQRRVRDMEVLKAEIDLADLDVQIARKRQEAVSPRLNDLRNDLQATALELEVLSGKHDAAKERLAAADRGAGQLLMEWLKLERTERSYRELAEERDRLRRRLRLHRAPRVIVLDTPAASAQAPMPPAKPAAAAEPSK